MSDAHQLRSLSPDIGRLRAIYAAAGRELRQMLAPIGPGTYSGVRAAEAVARAKELAATLNHEADRWAQDSIGRAYERSARVARTSLRILGRRPVKRVWDDRRRRIADDLMTFIVRANNSIPVVVDRYLAAAALASREVSGAQLKVQEFSFSQAEADVKKMAAAAVKAEISHGELAGDVRDYLYDLVQDDQFIEINGRMYRMNKYAELVARYELGAAATAATLDLCREYDNDLVEWSDHGTICEECKPFEGNVYSISGNNPDYPPLDEEPPIHPNCMHSLLPTSAEAISAREEMP